MTAVLFENISELRTVSALGTLANAAIVADDGRIEYFRRHIAEVGRAIDDGVEVMGYLPWGCVDLVSMATCQMSRRSGFVYVDADDEGNGTYERHRKKSFDWYRRVIATNGFDLGEA